MSDSAAAFLDTSVVVRYLTDDPPAMAARAAAVIDGSGQLLLSEVALVESAYVLTTVYKVPRAAAADALIDLVQRRNLRLVTLPKSLALEALARCRESRRTSFADAILWAQAQHARAARVVSFDRDFPGEGIVVDHLTGS